MRRPSTRHRTRRVRGDAGTTLVEVLVAVGILGVATTAILTGLVSFNAESNRHREQSTAITLLAYATETLTGPDVGYVPCAAAGAYAPAALTSGFDFATNAADWSAASVTIESVRFWNGAGFDTTCRDAGPTVGLHVQQVTVRVTSPDGRARAELAVVKRPT